MNLFSISFNGTVICNERIDVDLDALNLLASGDIVELCSCEYQNIKKHHYFTYNTEYFSPFTNIQDNVSFDNFVRILLTAFHLSKSLLENNLTIDNIKLAKDYIFISDDRVKFVYLPIISKSRLNAKRFFTKLLLVVKCKDIRAIQLLNSIKRQNDENEVFSCLSGFLDMFDATSVSESETETTLLDEEATTLLERPTLTSDNVKQYHSESNYDEETTILNKTNSDNSMNDAYGTVKPTAFIQNDLSETETTVLTAFPDLSEKKINISDEHSIHLYLIRNSNGEKKEVNITPFAIGKDPLNVDYIVDSESVSRNHATIIYEEGAFYIVDNDSTNGTIVEGIRVQSGERVELDNGYIILLGNESFQTCIEGE